jgi:hypothetical protein
MKHLLDILAIPSAIILIAYIVFYLRHKKEIDKLANEEMKKNPYKYRRNPNFIRIRKKIGLFWVDEYRRIF